MSDDIKTFIIIIFMIHYSKGVPIRVSELGCPNYLQILGECRELAISVCRCIAAYSVVPTYRQCVCIDIYLLCSNFENR